MSALSEAYHNTTAHYNGYFNADELIMLDIYPARELPIEGVTSDLILKNVALDKKEIVDKDALTQKVLDWQPEVVLTIGAGDIDKMVQPLKE